MPARQRVIGQIVVELRLGELRQGITTTFMFTMTGLALLATRGGSPVKSCARPDIACNAGMAA